jgi:hypothetical protein
MFLMQPHRRLRQDGKAKRFSPQAARIGNIENDPCGGRRFAFAPCNSLTQLNALKEATPRMTN